MIFVFFRFGSFPNTCIAVCITNNQRGALCSVNMVVFGLKKTTNYMLIFRVFSTKKYFGGNTRK